MEEVVRHLDAFLSEQEISDDLAYRITLVATEAITNAIKHGNAYDPEKKVTFDLYTTPSGFHAVVEDEGNGFLPENMRDPLMESNILKPGGRGIFLMKSLSDQCRFEKGGRCIHLIINKDDPV